MAVSEFNPIIGINILDAGIDKGIKMKMLIRDSMAQVNGDDTVTKIPSGGLEILGDNGRTLYSINLTEDGGLDISIGSICNYEGIMLDNVIYIEPRASNKVFLHRPRV